MRCAKTYGKRNVLAPLPRGGVGEADVPQMYPYVPLPTPFPLAKTMVFEPGTVRRSIWGHPTKGLPAGPRWGLIE